MITSINTENAFDFNAKYLLKYRYSNISAKPSLVYLPENYLKYDCILCAGEYDVNYSVLKFEYVPHKNLCDFKKVSLKAGETLTVEF